MKVIRRQPIRAFTQVDLLTEPNPREEIIEFPHDSKELEQIASDAINRRLELRETKDYPFNGTRIALQLRGRTSLYQTTMISEHEIISRQNDIKHQVIKHLVEGVLNKAMENVDKVYQLENSFWKRLKFLFGKY